MLLTNQFLLLESDLLKRISMLVLLLHGQLLKIHYTAMLLYILCFYFGGCWGFFWGFFVCFFCVFFFFLGGGVFCLIYYNLLHYYVAFLCMYLFKCIILSVRWGFNPLHCYSVWLSIAASADVGFAIWDRYAHKTESAPPIGYTAHLMGALAGLTIGLVVLKNFEQKLHEQYMWWVALAVYLGCVVFAIFWNIFYYWGVFLVDFTPCAMTGVFAVLLWRMIIGQLTCRCCCYCWSDQMFIVVLGLTKVFSPLQY